MAVNFGNKNNYNQLSSPESREAFGTRGYCREVGDRTLKSIYHGASYSDCMKQLETANKRLDDALDRANASAFAAFGKVNRIRH